jgi:hypothetical protein
MQIFHVAPSGRAAVKADGESISTACSEPGPRAAALAQEAFRVAKVAARWGPLSRRRRARAAALQTLMPASSITRE